MRYTIQRQLGIVILHRDIHLHRWGRHQQQANIQVNIGQIRYLPNYSMCLISAITHFPFKNEKKWKISIENIGPLEINDI